MADTTSYATSTAHGSSLTGWAFAFRAAMGRVRTALPVKVITVHGGGLAPIGRVDVQPLIQQLDAAGNVTALPVLYGLPYLRWQGGASAVILDPIAGDIGLVCVADRDVSAVIASGEQSAPGSNRRFNLADGFYIGATLNAQPTQYLQFDPDNGITLNSPKTITEQIGTDGSAARVVMNSSGIVLSFGGHSITINSSGIAVSGPQTNDSTITASGEVEGNGVKLSTHLTSGVTAGSSNSGPPIPG